MAFIVSIAFTPSVTPDGVTAPPTQGSLISESPSPYFYFDTLPQSAHGADSPL